MAPGVRGIFSDVAEADGRVPMEDDEAMGPTRWTWISTPALPLLHSMTTRLWEVGNRVWRPRIRIRSGGGRCAATRASQATTGLGLSFELFSSARFIHNSYGKGKACHPYKNFEDPVRTGAATLGSSCWL